MKGLLIKDFKLMKNQKNFFFIMIFIAAAMLFAEFESTFVVSYFTMIASMFVLSTISYDEYDNGYAFLFSMPFSEITIISSALRMVERRCAIVIQVLFFASSSRLF